MILLSEGMRLAAARGEPSPLGRREAGSSGHGEPPSCSGGARGCLGAPRAFRWSREARGGAVLRRGGGPFHRRMRLKSRKTRKARKQRSSVHGGGRSNCNGQPTTER